MSEQSSNPVYEDGNMTASSSVYPDETVSISMEWGADGRGELRIGLKDMRRLRDEFNKHLAPGVMSLWLWRLYLILDIETEPSAMVTQKLRELLGENWNDICREAFKDE